jgi:hypothetical protein
MDDSFQKYYSNKAVKDSKKTNIKAFRIKGPKVAEFRIKIVEGIMPIKNITNLVKEYNTTITIFLAAVLMCAINEEMPVRYKKRSVVLSIPVNLRNYWNSQTARNFFGVINVDYNFRDGSGELEDVIRHLQKVFKEKLDPEALGHRMNKLSSLEHNYMMRVIPLVLKDIFLRIGSNFVDKSYTSTLSNMGKVNMPNEIKQFISSFDVFVSTNKIQACVSSYESKLRVSFTSAFVSTEIQRHFFNTLTSMGTPVDIVSNVLDDE